MSKRVVIVKGVGLTEADLLKALDEIRKPARGEIVHINNAPYNHYLHLGTVKQVRERLLGWTEDYACLASMHDGQVYYSNYEALRVSPAEDQWRPE